MSEHAIEADGLVKVYEAGRAPALDGVSLKVGAGEWVAVSGPSGCGKSTFLHLAAALDSPTAGTLRVFGTDLAQHPSLDSYRRHEIGVVFQFHHLLPHLDANDNITVAMMGGTLTRKERRAHASSLLERVGLGGKDGVRPTGLSGGERQRLAIARAASNTPRLLLADEPTGALDSAATEGVLALFRSLRAEEGTTILMVTHDPAVAAVADRTVRMRDGRVVAGA
jgi:putative ABC transport system ATP-binding protein